MGHKIAEAIIENGQIKYVNQKLPVGNIKVHLIYDAAEEPAPEIEVANMVRETAGIYKEIDVEAESIKLRTGWERGVRN